MDFTLSFGNAIPFQLQNMHLLSLMNTKKLKLYYLAIKGVDEKVNEIPEEPFNIQNIKDKTRDIFMTSLYIDSNLDLFV